MNTNTHIYKLNTTNMNQTTQNKQHTKHTQKQTQTSQDI